MTMILYIYLLCKSATQQENDIKTYELPTLGVVSEVKAHSGNVEGTDAAAVSYLSLLVFLWKNYPKSLLSLYVQRLLPPLLSLYVSLLNLWRRNYEERSRRCTNGEILAFFPLSFDCALKTNAVISTSTSLKQWQLVVIPLTNTYNTVPLLKKTSRIHLDRRVHEKCLPILYFPAPRCP